MGDMMYRTDLTQITIAVCITIMALGIGLLITQCTRQENENIVQLKHECIKSGGTVISYHGGNSFHCIIIKGQNEGKVRSVHPMGG